ncbi:hypothetical protein [Pedobacter sp.]|uniref:hypothetical protein n=1 Tax=Pedobacter sp. TaxID=1411316 RepID=UPI003D7F6268
MKKFILKTMALLCFALLANSSMAQDTAKADPSLKGQYQLMLSKSRTLDGYKLVNPTRLADFWKNVRDTINTERKDLTSARIKISEQQKSINELQAQIQGKDTALSSSNAKLNEITFLGISFSKSTYNTIVWTLIIILGLALAILIFRSIKLAHEAKYRSDLYNEIATEYQNYKVKANDKEKKLARELQDERNKFEEFRSTGRK